MSSTTKWGHEEVKRRFLADANHQPYAEGRRGATAAGALALGALSIGALAIRLAIGQLGLGRAKMRRGEVDGGCRLTIGELTVQKVRSSDKLSVL